MKQRYEDTTLDDLDELYRSASVLPELRYVINDAWVNRVRHIIETWGPSRTFDDGAYNLFRILTDHKLPVAVLSITPQELDRRLQTIASLANSQRRNRDFRKTRSELGSRQNNQILGSLFEVNLLARLIELTPDGIEVFPRVGTGNRSVEARVDIMGRWIYVEARAIGYSKFDITGGAGSVSIQSMEQQVKEALDSKVGEGSQLRLVPPSNPSVLCLALGFYADHRSASWAIGDFLTEDTSNVGCIFMAESAFCNIGMRPFLNAASTVPLLKEEYNLLSREVALGSDHAKWLKTC